MTLPVLASASLAILIGLLFVAGAWPATVGFRPYRFLAAALGVGIGLGLTSLVALLWLLLAGQAGRGVIGLDLGLLAGLWFLARWRAARRRSLPVPPPGAAIAGQATRWIPALFAVTAVCAVAAFVGLTVAEPHGAWDAYMNWNLRARLLFRSGTEWRDAFSALLPWSHPDYPLLVQASVLRTWMYGGREALGGPASVAFLFTFGTAGLVGLSVGAVRSRAQGMLAAVMVLATPFFIFHGVSQYGDVPVGFFFLATVVLLCLHDRHGDRTMVFATLAGLSAGLATWTKNEGWLFLLALGTAWVATSLGSAQRRRLGRELAAFALGLAPILAVTVLFKLLLAPPNDLVTAAGEGHLLEWLSSPRRYAVVAQAFTSQMAGFGYNGMVSGVWLLLTYGICVGVRGDELRRRWVRAAAASIALILLGHAAVLVVAVEDVPRMLGSSLDRLLLQLWPAAVCVWFMVLCTPEEAAGRDRLRLPGAA